MRSDFTGKTRLGRLAAYGRAPALLLGLALPLFAPASAMPRAHEAVLLAAFPPTRTACHFTTGPLAGTTGAYASPADEKIGAPCDDGRGSRGTVVERPIGGAPRRIDRHTQPQPTPAQPPRPTPVVPTPVQRPPIQSQPIQPQPVQSQPIQPQPVQSQPIQQQPTQQPIQQPVQQQPIVNGASPDASTAYANLTDAQIQQEFDQIVQQASNGAIRYNVPPNMTVGQPMTVQVEVSGSNASQSPGNFPATGSGNLKVTPLMEVDLSAPNSPGMFQIVPDSVQTGQQMVPDNGKADWVWTVTPLEGGQQPASLQIDAYMVLNAKLPDGRAVTR
jgi:hypothetical protein